MSDEADELPKSEEEWRSRLGPERYRILRQAGTERPFTGEYEAKDDDGRYLCGGCGAPLFDSTTKYHSGSGWPSFYQPLGPERLEEVRDTSHGMVRVEVRCARCAGHLGHVFEDGPRPTGLRFCINSASLEFEPRGLTKKS